MNSVEKYEKIIKEKSHGGLSLVGEWNDKFITVKCNVCGKTFKADSKKFLENPVCTSKRCLNREERVKRIEKETNGEYTVVNKFYTLDKKSKDFQKVWVKHNKCGKVYPVVLRNFLNGRRCPDCTKTPFKTHEQYVEDVDRVGKNKFKVESNYIRATEDVVLNHSGGCKESFLIKAGAFLSDPRCPICEKLESKKKTREDYKNEMNAYIAKSADIATSKFSGDKK